MSKELLKPKYDVVFQALFQENKDNITGSLISDIIGEKIEIIEIKTESSLERKYPNSKTGRLDLKAKLKNGNICQIEIQLIDNKNTIKRLLYYWSRTYSEQIKRGDKYNELKKTIGIIITNYELEELKEIEELDTKWQIKDNKKGKRILTEDLELHIIELPKAKRILEKDEKNRIAQWMTFIDNPNTERVDKIVKENKEVKKAKSVLDVMSKDEELERLAFLEEKWERDELSLKYYHEEMERKTAEGLRKLEELQKSVDTKQKEVKEKQKEVKEKQKEVQMKEKEVETRENEVQMKEKEVETRENEVQTKEKEVETKEREVRKRQEELAKRKKELQEDVEYCRNFEIAKKMKLEGIDIEIIMKITGLSVKEIEKL